MKRTGILLSIFSVFAAATIANAGSIDKRKYNFSVRVRPAAVSEFMAADMFAGTDGCHWFNTAADNTDKNNDKNNDGIDDVVNTGLKIWDLIQANKPVFINKTTTASALPVTVSCWDQLNGWKRAQKNFEIVAKNGYGSEVVRYKYAVIYNYGGALKGQGEFLANVTVVPLKAYVSWGFTLDSNATIPTVQNLGTGASPIAGMEMRINWKIYSVVKHIEETEIYLVSGKGSLSAL